MKTPNRPIVELAVVLAICSASCAPVEKVTSNPTPGPNAQRCGAGEILFSTITQEGQRIPRVTVSIDSDEEKLKNVGSTDEFGEACIPKSIAFNLKVRCILFCKKNLHCTALINEEKWHDFAELPIVLSPWVAF